MDVEAIEALFTRSDGAYFCARWGRPIVPVVFGVEEEAIGTLKGAIEALCVLAGHQMAETDPELGVNLMMFFCRDWRELAQVPDLDRLVPELGGVLDRLEAEQANQYRIFRFEASGAIRACFVFVRMDAQLSDMPADMHALGQVVLSLVVWSDLAFKATSPLALAGGTAVLRPDIAEVIRAVYDPVMPLCAQDRSHALRLAARIMTKPYHDKAGGMM